MNAAREISTNQIPAVEIFGLRCEARAILVEACVYDLQDAVDKLQDDAVLTGLVDDIGQDAVQAMMARAFAIVPRLPSPGRPKKGLQAITLYPEPIQCRHAARSTLDAAEYLVQLQDPARLKAWLAKHSHSERIEISKHIHHGAKR
jgi:hypothetical protein